VAPVRISVVVLGTALLGTAAILAAPLPGGERLFFGLARLWSRLVLRTYRATVVTNRGPDMPEGRPVVFMSNHQSLLDVPALLVSLPRNCRFVAKQELSRIPIFGWALRAAGFVFIDRADRQRAIAGLDRAADILRQGRSVLVFAEGTRSPDGTLLPFKKGGFVLALKGGAPIVPVAVRGGAAILPKGTVGGRPGKMVVAFGPPVESGDYSMETKEALMETVRGRIAALLA
jgi:1-acyl-sn-glycerol-3-phosphate acyltransferase